MKISLKNKRKKTEDPLNDSFDKIDNDSNIERQKRLHSEDIQDIVTTMPIKLSYLLGIFVIIVLIILAALGYFVKYPEIISGKAVITTENAAVKVMMPSTGILKLKTKQGDRINKNGILGFLENSSLGENVIQLKQIVEKIHLTEALSNKAMKDILLPDNLSLGELEPYYNNFKNTFSSYMLFIDNNAYMQQINATLKLINGYKLILGQKENLQAINQKNLNIVHNAFKRDSLLFNKAVISRAEYESSQGMLLKSVESHERITAEILDAQVQISTLEKNLGQLKIEYQDKDNNIRNELVSSYNELIGQLYVWEKKYVLRSPVNGTVEFLDFIKNDQFLQTGSPVFNILPLSKPVRAETYVSSNGAGKIKKGQQVLVKLEDYPYDEYGFIEGEVEKVSQSTTSLSEEGNMTLVTVLFKNFKTNYGSTLQFKAGMEGTAEIITEDKRLIERVFERLNRVLRNRG